MIKTLIALFCLFIIGAKAQQPPLYEEKIKGNHANISTGTQTVVVGKVFIIENGNTKPLEAIITVKGLDKQIQVSENGAYWVEISDLVKAKKKIILSCKSKNYKTKQYVIHYPFTNEYKIDFELLPKKNN